MPDPFEKLTFLSDSAKVKLTEYTALLKEVNEKINLISRKDTDELAYRHVALCAAIGAFLKPDSKARIADVGTGGGLPGIVMAIIYPQAEVTMFDGVGKKIAAVNDMIKALKLTNAAAYNSRIEEFRGDFDYLTGRSVCNLPDFFNFIKKRLYPGRAGNLVNGVVYFKGGELEEQIIQKHILPDAVLDLEKYFSDARFEGKKILHFPNRSVIEFCRK